MSDGVLFPLIIGLYAIGLLRILLYVLERVHSIEEYMHLQRDAVEVIIDMYGDSRGD